MRRALAVGATLLAFVSVSHAGPIVTITLKDGKTINGEIQLYYEGRFSIRNRGSNEILELEASRVRAIDFGEIAKEAPRPGLARPLTSPEVAAHARERRFVPLLWAFRNQTPARLKELDGELALKLDQPGLAPEAQRDLRLARVLLLHSNGKPEEARNLLAKIRADRPADPVVRRFERQMQALREWMGDPRPPRPIPGKGPG